MLIYPAIDLYGGKAVRLYRGDYAQMTVYSENPGEIASDFARQGAACLHLVDLEGAKSGTTPNLSVISGIRSSSDLFTEVGGGIRTMEVVQTYLNAGVDRVILGTAAVTDEEFLRRAVGTYGEKIAVGVDLKDGCVAIKGWTQNSNIPCDEFFQKLQRLGVSTVICTDISRDGAMQGTNLELYAHLSGTFSVDIIASGGVSTLEDIHRLRQMELYGAIIGKAYYTGAVSIRDAVEAAR